MSLHQDKDEHDFAAPIVSVSLGSAGDLPVRRPKARRQAAPLPAGAWRRRGMGRAVAAVLPRRRPACRRRARPDGPPAHQPDFPQGAVIFPSPTRGEGKRAFHRGFPWFMIHKPGVHMTTSEVMSEASASANSTGAYLAVLQLVFTLGWTTYVIYLPKLCADVGIAPAICHPDPDAGSGDLHHHRHRDGNCRRQDRTVRRQAWRVRGHPDCNLLRGLHRAAVCGRHRARRAGLVHRPDPDLGRDVVGVARAAADIAGQTRCAAGDPVSRGAGDARLRPGRGGIALSRRGAAQSRPAIAVRDLRRGAAAYDACVVAGRTRPCAGACRREKAAGAGKVARSGADVLHRLDGHSVARLSTAFFHQQHAVLSALRKAGRVCNG